MNQLRTLAILFSLLAFAGCRKPTSSPAAEQPIPVHTIAIVPANGEMEVQVSGIIKPMREADIAAQIIAPVVTVTKQEGEHFRRGEVLVRLRAPALDANVAEANATMRAADKQVTAVSVQATLATETLERYAQLRERHSVTPYELDQVRSQDAAAHARQQETEAQVVAAQSALAAQRATANEAVLYAPFDGVVTKRMVDPGAMATPGVPLLHVQSVGSSQVELSAPEDLARSLSVGTRITVSLLGDAPIQATIVSISPADDAGSHSFVAKAVLPASASWNTGTVVAVSLPSGRATNRILVPSSAILQQGGLDAVLVATPDSRAQVRYVTLGASSANQAEILSGLQLGDRVVAQGNLGLAGHKIEVQP
ncbi:MAG: efflux RND transporter periplasmic adaptor subunit [Edaphobacter sp.]